RRRRRPLPNPSPPPRRGEAAAEGSFVIGSLRRGRAIVPFLFLAAAAAGPVPDDPEDWTNSPEAYCLTSEEKEEWRKLPSRDSRHDFIERYWLKRDPTPGTGRNQFRDTV